MKNIPNLLKVIIVIMFISLIGCSKNSKENTEQLNDKSDTVKPLVIVSNYPLYYFVERLNANVDLRFPAAESTDPAYWKPNADDISNLQNADLIILNGADYEKWLSTVSVPATKLMNSLKGFDDRLIKISDKVTHSHGLEGVHEHAETAFTTWLDFELCIVQAEAIKEELILLMPSIKNEIEKNFISLKTDLNIIKNKMKAAADSFEEKFLYASHPVYQYLSKAYNLNIISEHWEPNEIPSEETWNQFTDRLKRNPSVFMLWENEPLPEVEAKLNGLGLRCLVFTPCGSKPKTGDFLTQMNANIERLQVAD